MSVPRIVPSTEWPYAARMDTLAGIEVFLEVVGTGSFVAAAERLNVSTATVNQHVMHLERRLGVRLLTRNSRCVSPTEPGHIYFERCRVILDNLREAELHLGSHGAKPGGTLRITCPSWFAGRRFTSMLARYRVRFPEVIVHVAFEDRVVDLAEDGYDLALRVAPSAESLARGLIARPVRSLPFFVAASRGYIERNGAPESPTDLARHDCIAVADMDSWVFQDCHGRTEVPARIVQRFRSMSGVPHAVAAGIGLAPLPVTLLEEPAFRNVLVPVLSDFPYRQTTAFLVYISRKYVPLKIRSFVDFFLEFAAGRSVRNELETNSV